MIIKLKDRFKQFIVKCPLLTGMLYSFLIFLVVFIFAYPCWETSDDFLISGILSGMAGESSPYVLVIGYPLSWVLHIMGQWFPRLNWLTMLELFSVWSSFAVYVWIFLKKGTKEAYFSAFIMPLVFEPSFYMSLQYTRSAFLMAFTGLFLIYYCSFVEKKKMGCVIGGCLLILGSLSRYACTFLGIPYVGLWVVIEAARTIRDKKFSVKKNLAFLTWVTVFFLIVIALNQYHKYAYTRFTEENTYVEFNTARAKAYDYLPSQYDFCASEFEEIDLSFNDYEMLKGSMIYDDFFNIDLYRSIAGINFNINQSLSQKWDIVKTRFWKSFSTYGNGRLNGENNIYILFFFSAGISFVFLNKRTIFSCFSLLVGTMIIAFYFVWTGRFPPWVQDSLFLIGSFSLLYGVEWKNGVFDANNEKGKIKQTVSAIICIVLIASSLYVSGNYFMNKAKKIVPDEQMCLALNYMENDEQNIYIIDNFSDCPYPIMDAYGSIRGMTNARWENIVRVGSWFLEHPVLNEQSERLGLNSPIYDMIQENVYLFSDIDSSNLNRYKIFFKEHYKLEVAWELVNQWDDYAIYSFYIVE